MSVTKQTLSFEDIEAQAATELPDRDMLALINIIVFDVLNDVNVAVQVPIGVAANVCGVQANVLAQDTTQTIDCSQDATLDQLPRAFQ